MIIGFLIDRKRLQVSKNNFLFAMRRATSLLRAPAIRNTARHVATKTPNSGQHHAIGRNRLIERIFASIWTIPTLAYSRDLLRTFAVPSPYLGRFMFGFRYEIRG